MERPRIIIADTDRDYIIPLLLRFAEEFFDKIDLEIITDRGFFEEAFLTPQKAEILVVSDGLYSPSLHRHNIGSIFLMTEQYEEGQTDELNVTRIFKYTSIREIFNEIVGKGADVLKTAAASAQEPQIVLVCSAAGGVGKTTVAMGMAACLTRNYKKVFYINAGSLHSFQRMLENKSPISDPEAYAKLSEAAESLYGSVKHVLRKELFTYLPPFKAPLVSLGLSGRIYGKLALSAKKSGDFDYIIVDADAGFDEEKTSLIGIADRVIVVTKQSAASVYATSLFAANINGINSDKYLFVCNDFIKENGNALTAPDSGPQFTVSDYVGHMDDYDAADIPALAKSADLQRVSFLVL